VPRYIASVYILAICGMPILVQIVFIYTGRAATGIMRFEDFTFAGIAIPGNLQAGILALGLHEGAYMAEIFCAGIGAVDNGQSEAAKSLDMPP
jgi:polar amino acid transport system permease protein